MPLPAASQLLFSRPPPCNCILALLVACFYIRWMTVVMLYVTEDDKRRHLTCLLLIAVHPLLLLYFGIRSYFHHTGWLFLLPLNLRSIRISLHPACGVLTLAVVFFMLLEQGCIRFVWGTFDESEGCSKAAVLCGIGCDDLYFVKEVNVAEDSTTAE